MTYNRREIMRNAWDIRRTAGVSMSIALKSAWALAKAMNSAEEAGAESGRNYKVSANDWVKYGRNRTYVSARIYTNAWRLKNEIRIGYVDNMTGAFVASDR